MEIDSKFKEALLKKNNGEIIEAENIFKKILDLSPLNYKTLINLGLINIEKKNYQKSIFYFKKAIDVDSYSLDSYINLGNIYIITKKYKNAIKIFNLAKTIDQNNETIINNLSFLYNEIGDIVSAKNIIDKGLNIRPHNYFLLNLLGLIFIKQEKIEKGISCYIQSIKSKKNFWHSYDNLLYILQRTNKIHLYQKYIEEAKKIFFEEPALYLHEANYYLRIKNFKKSKSILINNDLINKLTINEDHLVKYHDLLAKTFDNLNQSDFAFFHFQKRNFIKSNQAINKVYNKNIILDLIQDYKNYFIKKNVKKFTNIINTNDYPHPIFLVGFPRSGTTLLDSILRTHPQISVFEERPIVSSVRDNFFEKHDKQIDSLRSLKQKDILLLQKSYFKKLNDYAEEKINDKIIIDKFPLNLIEIGFIHRVFPKSKFILMLRHPCDVVLSCFIADFKINEGMANFYTLEDAVKLYNEVFSLWKHYNSILDINFHIIKYENIVLNFDNTIKKLMFFLNIQWHDDLKNFNAKARSRKKINTPSYDQVIQPLYDKSINRWKKYDEMKSYYPLLKNWIKEFKY